MHLAPIFYAGIGSREAPLDVLLRMQRISTWLALMGFTLRSGAANGSDTAFESACDLVGGLKDIWLPWPGFNKHDSQHVSFTNLAHYDAAAQVHPSFFGLKQSVQALHARNMGQISGCDLNTDVAFVVCWTPDGCDSEATRRAKTGGTATAIVAAARKSIPIYNLFNQAAEFHLFEHARLLAQKLRAGKEQKWINWANIAHFVANSVNSGKVHASEDHPLLCSKEVPLPEAIPGDILPVLRQLLHAVARQPAIHLNWTYDFPAMPIPEQAKLIGGAPPNCTFPPEWQAPEILISEDLPWNKSISEIAPAANLHSGAKGLPAALSNASESARLLGGIKHSYPVTVNDHRYEDVASAFEALKAPNSDAYNDGLMIDLIALKFVQNPKLLRHTIHCGGAAWLEKCAHFTARPSIWDGHGYGSRFLHNLIWGFKKALTGRGPVTRVVHVGDAPYDVYIGRDMTGKNPKYLPRGWGNDFKQPDGDVAKSLKLYADNLFTDLVKTNRARSLQGLTLGCWCKSVTSLDRPCHGEILVAAAEGKEYHPPQERQQELF